MRYLRICRFKSKIRLERSSWGSTPLENQIHLLLISVRVYKDSNKHSNNLSKDLVQSWGYLPLKNPKIKKKYKTPPISTFHNTQTIQRLKKNPLYSFNENGTNYSVTLWGFTKARHRTPKIFSFCNKYTQPTHFNDGFLYLFMEMFYKILNSQFGWNNYLWKFGFCIKSKDVIFFIFYLLVCLQTDRIYNVTYLVKEKSQSSRAQS